MALEILKSIARAEQQAQEMKNAAQAQAQAVQAQAEESASHILAGTKTNAKAQQQSLVEKAVLDSKPKVSAILEEALKACEAIEKLAAQKKSKAVEAVIRKVVGADGNC